MVERLPMGIVIGRLNGLFERGLKALGVHLHGVSVVGGVAALDGVGGHGASPWWEGSRGQSTWSAASSRRRVAVTIDPARRAASA